MPTVPFAFSVHHFVTQVGAYVGFAAVVGLALMVLLFFAHARETATLRRRAEESDERVDRLESYVEQLARMGAAAAQSAAAVRAGVTPPPASATRVAPAGRVAPRAAAAAAAVSVSRVVPGPVIGQREPAPTFAPAGVGAPALASATKLIPAGDIPPLRFIGDGAGQTAGDELVAVGTGAGQIFASAGTAVRRPMRPVEARP